MSVHVTAWVLQHSEAKLGDRLVLLALADRAAEHPAHPEWGFIAWPSVPCLARDTRLSERQVQRCLRNLETSGDIAKVGKKASGVNVYQVGGDILSGVTPTSPEPSVTHTLTNVRVCATPTNQTSTTTGLPIYTPAKPRPRDPLWDALVDVLDLKPDDITKNLRGKLNTAVKQLRDVNANPDEVPARARKLVERWGPETLTATSLATHWARLAPRTVRPPCAECGIGGGYHSPDCGQLRPGGAVNGNHPYV